MHPSVGPGKQTPMEHLANCFGRHRRLFGYLVIVLTVIALIGMSRLKVDSNPRAMLNARDLQAGPLRLLEEDFGDSDDCVIVLQADDFITPAGVRVVGNLVAGVKRVVVLMDHNAKDGSAKLLKECTLPLTGKGVVDVVITELGVFEIEGGKMRLAEIAPEVSLDEIEARSEAEFAVAPELPAPA